MKSALWRWSLAALVAAGVYGLFAWDHSRLRARRGRWRGAGAGGMLVGAGKLTDGELAGLCSQAE